jgi:hypothetical protein
MRNPFKREPWQDPSAISPEDAIHRAQEAMAKTKTMRDSSGRRVRIGDEQRAQMEAALARVAAAQAAPPVSPPAGDDDRLAQLERLGELHASGVLNDAEFAAEKARILG